VFMRLRGPNIIGSSLFVLTGLVFNLRANNEYDAIAAIFIISSMVMFNIYIWVSNDYYDAPWDKEDDYKGKRNVFCDETGTRDYRIGQLVLWLSMLLGLISGLIADLLTANTIPVYFLFALAGMLLSFFYSNPIFRAKGKPGWDWIFHVLWFQISFLPLYLYIFGFEVIWTFDIQFYSVFLYISMLSLLAQINHQIPDHDIDLKTGQITTVVKIGVNKTKKLRLIAYFLISLGTFSLCWVNEAWMGLLLIIVYTLVMMKINVKAAEDSFVAWVYIFLLDYLFLTPAAGYFVTLI